MTNHVDRFHAALTVLAGHGHIKQRLIKAYEENLVEIHEDELPIAIKQSFADLRAQMHSVTPAQRRRPDLRVRQEDVLDEASECAAVVTCSRCLAMREDCRSCVEAQDARRALPFERSRGSTAVRASSRTVDLDRVVDVGQQVVLGDFCPGRSRTIPTPRHCARCRVRLGRPKSFGACCQISIGTDVPNANDRSPVGLPNLTPRSCAVLGYSPNRNCGVKLNFAPLKLRVMDNGAPASLRSLCIDESQNLEIRLRPWRRRSRRAPAASRWQDTQCRQLRRRCVRSRYR